MIKTIRILIALVTICQLFSCGLIKKNGFIKNGSDTYYYINDEKQTGWQAIDGYWYFFFKESGAMANNVIIEDADGKEYFFNYNGRMWKNVFKTIGATKYRINKNGTTVALGTIKETACFGEDGARLKNTQKEIDGNLYIIDENGIAKQQPDYQLVFDSSFPITIYSYGDAVIIEKIDYELYELKELPGSSYRRGGQVFETYWTGIAGNSYKGSNYSTPRYVGYKLYDPNGYVIETGSFSTGVALAMGERFKDKHMRLSSNITKKGIYKLKLLGESK